MRRTWTSERKRWLRREEFIELLGGRVPGFIGQRAVEQPERQVHRLGQIDSEVEGLSDDIGVARDRLSVLAVTQLGKHPRLGTLCLMCFGFPVVNHLPLAVRAWHEGFRQPTGDDRRRHCSSNSTALPFVIVWAQ